MEIVMAAVALIERDGRVLMLRRRQDDRSYPGMWCLPGGRVDPGESPVEAVEREVFEETGLRVRVGEALVERDSTLEARARIYRIVAFAVVEIASVNDAGDGGETDDQSAADQGGALRAFPSEEHVEAAWVEPGAALRDLKIAGSVTLEILRALVARG